MNKPCRDCRLSFELADVRQILCVSCRKARRAENRRRQMKAWWARQSESSRSALYKRQWQGQKHRFNELRPELQGVVNALGNLRRRISEESHRRSA